jgi:hypothetical protein
MRFPYRGKWIDSVERQQNGRERPWTENEKKPEQDHAGRGFYACNPLILGLFGSRIERVSGALSAVVPVPVRLLWPGEAATGGAMVQSTSRITKRVFDRTLVPSAGHE